MKLPGRRGRLARALPFALLLAVPLGAQSSGIRSWCNPLDLDYRYNFENINDSVSYRSGADPVIVTQGGQYYLFATIAAGYWRSPDLVHWTHVRPSRWPFDDIVAPAALAVRDTIFLLQSAMEPRPLLYTTAAGDRAARVVQPDHAAAA